MCQVTMYVREQEKEELIMENVTSLEPLASGYRVGSLFEAPSDFEDLVLEQIDFLAGKLVFRKG